MASELKILVVLSRFPYPLEKGDKLRAYHQIKGLSQKNEIVLFALSDIWVNEESKKHLKQFCADIKLVQLSPLILLFNLLRSLFKNIPFQVGYFYSSKAQKELDKIDDKTALRISQKIYQLETDPYGQNSQKLGGGKGYRIRAGDYRVVYAVDKTAKTVTIIKIRHRREVYR